MSEDTEKRKKEKEKENRFHSPPVKSFQDPSCCAGITLQNLQTIRLL